MTSMTNFRTYSELLTFSTFEERFKYLQLNGRVGESTFGYDRYLNQIFYTSKEWRNLRDHVIVRDCGNDLGVDGYRIYGKIYVHHMNPITVEDIKNRSRFLLDPEFLICCSHNTHEAITYGDESLLITVPIERTKYDTCPWRQK